MPFSPFSSVVRPAEHVSPIPFDVYTQGLAQMSHDNQLAYQDVQNQYQKIDNIPVASQADAKVLQEKLQSVRGELGNIALNNLRDPSVKQKINSFYSEVTNDPDIQAIAKRGYTYQNELRNKKDAESKGKMYISPILKQAEKYSNQGVYVRDENFNGEGWIDPEIEKMKSEILPKVQKVKKQVYKDGRWMTEESYDQGQYESALRGIYSHPDVQKTLQYNFDNQYEGTDWETQGSQLINTNLQAAQDQADTATQLLQINPNNTKAQASLQEANSFINQYKSADPRKVGENIKEKIKTDTINKHIQDEIDANQFVSQDAVKADEFALKSQDLKNDLTKELYKGKVDLFGALSKEDQLKFQTNPNDNTIDWSQAYQTSQLNKRKNAAAAFNNPNLVSSEVILNFTDSEWNSALSAKKSSGKEALGDDATSKRMIVSLIKTRPDLFPNIPKAAIDELSEDLLDINDGGQTAQIDLSRSPFNTTYDIPRESLIKAKNMVYLESGQNKTAQPNTSSTILTFKKGNDTFSIPAFDKEAIDTANARGFVQVK